MVECTGLENQQACKRLGSSNLPSSAIVGVTPELEGCSVNKPLHSDRLIGFALLRRVVIWIDPRYAANSDANAQH